MMIGMVMTTAAAAMGPVGTVNCELPLKYSMAAGAVRELSVEVNEIANRKSFQQARKTRIAVVTMPGAASGAMTRMNAWNGVAPSTLAAFSSSHGISRKNADRMYIPNGSPNAMYGMIRPGQVLNSPSARSMVNNGVTSAISGNMAISSAIPMSTLLPGNRSRAMAYAAMEASPTATIVEMRPMPIEFSSGRRNCEDRKSTRLNS